MALKDYHKPNWYPEDDVVATKSGWVNSQNFGEVLVAIPNLDKKLSKLDDSTTAPNPPSITVLNSLNVRVSGLVSAPVRLKVGPAGAVNHTTDVNGDYIYVLTSDLSPGTTLVATQEDPDSNESDEVFITVVNKMLKGAISVSNVGADPNGLDVDVALTNVANGSDVRLYVDDVLAAPVAVVNTAGVKTATFTNVDLGDATSVKFNVKAIDLVGKEISTPLKTQSVDPMP